MSSLPKISPELIKTYQSVISASSSPSTAKRKAISLNRFFDWAETQGHIDENPMPRISPITSTPQVVNAKKHIGTKTYAIVGLTVSLVTLIFLLTWKLKFPIPFIRNFAQSLNNQVTTNTQVGSPISNPITATSSGNVAWNLYAKLKLSDTNGLPLIGSQTLRFKLFNQASGGDPVYTSVPETVTTDANGTALISLDGVPNDLFFQNNRLYLEPEIGGQTETSTSSARIPVSTANTAANLGGYYPGNPNGAGPETVPVINSDGSLLIASESPAVKAVSGNLLIEGQTVTVKATDGSGGNIEINPDANGYAHFLFEGNKGNFLNAQAPNLTSGSLYYGVVPNNSTGYYLINLQNGSKLTTRFSVDAGGNTNMAGDLSTGGVDRLTNLGVLQNITGYSQSGGNFTITQTPGDFVSINKTITSGGALSDVMTLTLDERGKPATKNSDYSTLVLNRYDGNGAGAALKVNTGNAIFNGQVQLGRFTSNPNSIGVGSMVYNTGDDQVYVWTGSAWTAVGAGTNPPFSAITSETNTVAAMIVGTGASLTYSGSGTVNASSLNGIASGSFLRSDTTNSFTSGTLTTNAGTTFNIAGTFQIGGSNVTSSATEINYLDGSSVTAGGVIYGNGTYMADTGAGSSGQILVSAGAGTPAWQNIVSSLTQGTDISITGTTNATISNTSTLASVTGRGATTNTQVSLNGGITATGDLTLSPVGNVNFYSTSNKIDSAGNLTIAGKTTFAGIQYTWPSSIAANNYVLQAQTSGSLAWVDPAAAVSSSIYWTQDAINGVLYPKNNTVDVLIGSDSTASAKFAFTGVAGGTPTATIAGNIAGVATYLTGNGTLATTNMNHLTFGNAYTGGVDFASTITSGTWNGSVVAANYGGTGFSTYAVGDILYAGTTTTLAKLADVAIGKVLRSGGVNTAPAWGDAVLSIAGTTNQIDASAATGNVTLSIPSDFRAPGTVNAVNGLYTGATAGTQRIDVNGNLLNIANISASGYATVSGSLALGSSSAAAGPGNLNMSGNLTADGTITGTSIYQGANQVCDISGNCTGSNIVKWRENLGTLSPYTDTLDVLIGSNATASAKFAFTGVASGTPTASISGTTANVATFIDGNGNISSTNRNNLTLGNSATYNSTGNILLNPNGTGNVGIGTTGPGYKLHVVSDSSTRFNNSALSQNIDISAQGRYINIYGNGTLPYLRTSAYSNYYTDFGYVYGSPSYGFIQVTSNSAVGNLAINASGGNVGIGTTSPTSLLDVAGSASVSGSLTFRAGTGTIQTTAFNPLVLGGSTTGNITLNPSNAVAGGYVAPNTTNVSDLGTASLLWRNIYGTTLYQGANQVCDISGNCTGSSVVKWRESLGTLSPYTDTLDVLIGSNATSSAKFAFTGVNTGGTPVASIAGTTAGVATYLTGEGNLATTNRAPLLLGNTLSSGAVQFFNSSSNIDSSGNLTIAGNLDVNGTTNDVAGTLNLSGGALTSTGVLTVTPQATNGLNIVLSGAGNFSVNTNTFQVDANGRIVSIDGVAHTIEDVTGDLTLSSASTNITLNDNVTFAGTTTLNSKTYTWPGTVSSGNILQVSGTGPYTLDWVDPVGAVASSIYWTQGLGALYPKNNSVDVLIGSNATATAKFAFTGVAGGTPTASISGTTTNSALYLDGNGNIATTNMQPLVLGSATTGSVQLSPYGKYGLFVNGLGDVNIGSTASPSAQLMVTGSDDQTQLIVKGNSTQTANLQEWQNSSGTVLGSINGTGITTLNPTSTNGAASFTGLSMVGTKTSAGADATNNYGADISISTSGTQNYSGATIGISGNAYHLSSGTLTALKGLSYFIGTGNSGVVTTGTVINLKTYSPGTGIITTINGINIENLSAYSSPTTTYAININASTTATGTTKYGLYVGNLSGATNNYAIYTNSGLNRFGDNISILGYATASASLALGNANAAIGPGNLNMSGNLTANGTITGTTIYQGANQVCDISGNCTGSSVVKWRESLGTLSPYTDTLDVLIGSNATSSAKFAFTGVNTGGTPDILINNTSVLNATTLGTGVVTSSLTTVGALSSGSIASGFGTITTANTITGTTINGTTGINTGAGAGTQRIDASGNLSANYATVSASLALGSSNAAPGPGNLNMSGNLTADGTITGASIYQGANQVCDVSGNCDATTGYWRQTLGVLYPANNTVDLLIGASATASAKFAFTGVNGGTPNILINNVSVLNATTLGTNVVTSSLTTVGTLASGSIANGFGTITTGNTITGTTINGTTGINTGAGAGTQRIDASGNLSANYATASASLALGSSAAAAGPGNLDMSGNLVAAGNITGVVLNGTTSINTGAGAGTARIDASGNLKAIGTTQINGVTYTWPASTTTGYVLKSLGTGTSASLDWVDPATAVASSIYWTQAEGALFPKNNSVDVLIGANATASAKIAFTNINTGTPTIYLANQASNIALKDNTASALNIFESANNNNYLNITTSNTAENMAFGNTTTNPSFTFLGTGLVTTGGNLKVAGNNIQDAGGTAAITFDGSANTQTNGNLTVAANKNLTLSTGTGSMVIGSSVTNTSKNVVDITPAYAGGATDSLTYNILNIAAFSPTNAAGTDLVNGMEIGALTDPGATITSTALKIGAGWDNVLTVNGTVVINSTGQVPTGQLTGTLFSNSADSNAGTNTIVQGDTLTINGGVNGIDTSLSNDTYTLNLDTTEIGTTTFGAGAGFTWTFDTGGTKPTLAFADNAVTATVGTLALTNTTTLTASSLATLTTAASLGMGSTTTLTLGGNATINGGTGSGGTLTLVSTTNGTKGDIQFFSSANKIDATGNLAVAGTVTGTTLNGTTGINTGAGAGTLRIDASGNLKTIGTTQFNGVTYTWPATATENYVLQAVSSGASTSLTWADPAAAVSSTIYWTQGNGVLFPKNNTVDVLIGANSTSSAKFAFTGVNTGGTPTASISATNGNSTYLTATGTLATTNMQTLTLGGTNTSQVLVNNNLNLASGKVYQIDGTSVLSNTTLGTSVVNSSLTSVGALVSGSIANGFGTITTGNTITGTTINGTTGINTGAGAGILRIDASGNLSASYATASASLALGSSSAAPGPGNLDMSGNLTVGGTTTLGTRTYTWPGSESAGFLTTNGTGGLGWTTTLPSATTIAFDKITSGTNTVAAMIVGTGASLTYHDGAATSGEINASLLQNANWAAPLAIGSGTPNTGAFTALSATTLSTSSYATVSASLALGSSNAAAGPGNLNMSGNLTADGTITGTTIYQGANQVCDAGGSIPGCGGISYWGQNLGALYPLNNTVDLLIGASATTSAKFAFKNILTGTPTFDVSVQATNIAIKDNVTNSLQILEGANPYLAINTNNTTENMSFGNTTINPSFSFLGSGTVTIGGDLAVNGAVSADINTTTLAATIFNTTATTLSLGGAATTLNIGTTDSVTRAINIGTGNGVDTIHVGDGGTGADVITIGSANAGNVTVQSGAALALVGSTGSYLTFPNFAVSTSGIITKIDNVAHTIDDVAGDLTLTSNSTSVMIADDLGVNGATSADITTTTSTATVFNTTATTLSMGGAATTINLLGSTGSSATLNIGNSSNSTALNLTSGTGVQTFTSSVATGTGLTGAFVFKDVALSSGDMIYATASGNLSTGNLLKLGTGGNTTFSGNAIYADLDNTGQGGLGFTGNFLKFDNNTQTKFLVDSAGNATIHGVTYTWPTSAAGTTGFVLTSDTSGVLSWAAQAGGTNYWQLNSPILSPANTTYDLTIGGIATGSAFQVFGAETAASGLEKLTSTVTTIGNVFEATASAITSGNMIKLGQGGNSAGFTGNGLFMDFNNTGSSLFTGNFLKFNNANITKFALDSAGNASMSGTLTLGYGQTIRPAYGPLSLAYKSGPDTWTTGLTLNDTTGNVGIGTTAPSSRLHVVGSSSVATIGVSNLLTADGGFDSSTGWTVGTGWTIGSSVATHATGNTAALSGTSTATSTSTVYQVNFTVAVTTAGDGFNVSLGGNDSGSTFKTAGAKTIYIQPAAGTGTLSFTPGTAGTFVGTIDTVSIYAITPSTADATIANSDGTASNLEIRSGGSGTASLFLGLDAGKFNTTTGGGNNGKYNNFIGYQAGEYNAKGSSNNALGYRALYSNTTGSGNIAIGDESLLSNTTGNSNIALGGYSLWSHVSGYDNIAIGNSALVSQVTGSEQIAIGASALINETGGWDSTAIGVYALQGTSQSIENTAIGAYSLSYYNLSGNYNTAVGGWALNYLTTGSYNTALGEYAGYKLTTGTNNTFLGYGAGNSVSQKVDAINSMALGNGTYTTASNQIVIGNMSIDQTLLNGNVGIRMGMASPSAALQIGTGTATHTVVSNELFTTGNFELDGVFYLDGGTISNSAGTGTVLFSSTPTTTANTLSAGNWLVENTANLGEAALMVNQTKAGDLFTASSSSTPKFTIHNDGAITLATIDSTANTNEGTIYYDSNSIGSSATDHLFLRGSDSAWHRIALDMTKYSATNATVANGSYVQIAHNQNTNDLAATGWVYDTISSLWKNVSEFTHTIKNALSNEWNQAASSGIIRSTVKLTDVELSQSVNTGTGADGAIIVSSNRSINASNSISGRTCTDIGGTGGDAPYYAVSSLTSTTATLGSSPSSNCLTAGDEVLLINVQSNSSANVNVGVYETLRVQSVVGTTVTFTTAKTKYYGSNSTDDTGIGTVQKVTLQRVPNYTDVTVNSTINFYPDNYSYTTGLGGIIFFRASGTVTVSGLIHAFATGYIGGTAATVDTTRSTPGQSVFYGTGTDGNGGYQSSTNGVAGTYSGGGGATGGYGYTTGTPGSGSSTNGSGGGGGGGNEKRHYNGTSYGAGYAGGGGGGGYGVYGSGGQNTSANGSNGSSSTSGAGGTPYEPANTGYGGGGGGGSSNFGTSSLTKLFLGSGGGGGGAGENSSGTDSAGGDGGRGGGIVSVAAGTITITGSISSAGQAGTNAINYGGAGGGGSGGSVLLAANTLTLGTDLVWTTAGSGGTNANGNNGGAGGNGITAIFYTTSYTGSASSPTPTYTQRPYYPYGLYHSAPIATMNAVSYDALRWESSLNTYGNIEFQTRSGPDQTLSEVSSDASFIGLWHMNETANGTCAGGKDVCDSSSSGNHGTVTGTTIEKTNKVFGAAARNFSAYGSSIDVGDVAAVDSATSLSACAWVYNTSNKDQAIISKASDTIADGFSFVVDEVGVVTGRTNTYKIFVGDSADTDFAYIEGASGAARLNAWDHVCFTYTANSSTGLRLYVNGIEDANSPASTVGISAIDAGTNTLQIGSYRGTNNFVGIMDEVYLTNDVRTAAEIRADANFWEAWKPALSDTSYVTSLNDANTHTDWQNAYTLNVADGDVTRNVPQFEDEVEATAGNLTKLTTTGFTVDKNATLTTNLASYWPLNESSAGTGAVSRSDAYGTNTLTDNGTTPSGTGILSNAISATTANLEYLSCTDANCGTTAAGKLDFTQAQDFSLEAWVKTSTAGTVKMIMSKKSVYNDTTAGYSMYYDAANKINCTLDDGAGNGATATKTSAATYTDGAWHNVVCVVDETAKTLTMYIDGTPETGTASTASYVTLDNASDFRIGAQGGGTTLTFTGLIDEVGVWRKALSSSEVTDIYNAAAAITYPASGQYAQASIASANISTYDYVTFWVRASQTGNSVKFGFGEAAATEQEETVTIDAANTWQKVYWDLSDIAGTSRDAVTKLRFTNLSSAANTIYIDNIRAEKHLSTGTGSQILSTPNNFLQYRAIFTTTNTSYQPQLNNVYINYNDGYKIVQADTNNVRLYNYSGSTQQLRIDATVFGADLAEWYTVNDQNIGAGDVVALTGQMDENGVPILRKAESQNDPNLIGIISTKAGQILGIQTDKRRLLALAGRVPVKIDPASPAIAAGDAITSSGTSGMARRASFGDITIAKAAQAWKPGGATELFVIVNNSGSSSTYLTTIENYQILKNAVTGIWEAVDSTTQEAVKNAGVFANLIAANIKAGAIETRDFVAENLIAKNLAVKLISPLADETNVTVQIGSTATPSGQFVIQNASGSAVATIDNLGNATFAGTVNSQQLTVNSEATVAGTLYADNIKSKSLDEIQALLTKVQGDQDILKQAANWSVLTATDSANIDQLAVSDLYVTNQGAFNSLSVTNSLSIGSDLVLSSQNALNSLSAPLRIQSLAMAPVEIMAGLVKIDTLGNVRITGNLAVGGNLNVAGRITSTGLTLQPDLTRSNLVSTDSASLLTLQNTSGNTVSTVDASGSAIFNGLSARGLTIAAGADATQAGTIVNGVITTNSTIGTATIPAGLAEVTISNPKVTDYTLVYVTPTSTTDNYVLYVKSKENGKFVVGFTNPISVDVNFNWWIVQIQ